MSEDIKQYAEQFLMTYSGTEIGDFITHFIDGITKSNLTTLEFIKKQTNIDTAEGIWLDYIGLKVGLPRPYLPNKNIPIFTLDIPSIPPGEQALAGFDGGHFIDDRSLEATVPLTDNLYREKIKLQNAINHDTITHDLVLQQIAFITPKVPQMTVIQVAQLVITFGVELDSYEKYLFEAGYLTVPAGVLVTVEDPNGVIIGEPVLGFGSYFEDYVDASGLPLPVFNLV